MSKSPLNGTFLLKRVLYKYGILLLFQKIHIWEERALYRRWWIYYSRDCGMRYEMFGWEKSVENTKELLVHWGRAISTNCARTLAMVADKGPQNGRATMMKNKTLIKVTNINNQKSP
jgi:hypothetical protein